MQPCQVAPGTRMARQSRSLSADVGGEQEDHVGIGARAERDRDGRETRLDAVDPPGTYRSSPLPPGTLSPQLTVRVYFSNMRVEVPVEP